jgi:hypothetical protein
MNRWLRLPQSRYWIIGAVILIVLGATAGLVFGATNHAGPRRERHPHADLRLIPFVDHGRVIGFHADCRDHTDLGYVPNNLCIDSLLVGSRTAKTERAFQQAEVARLHRADWRLFSPTDFGFPSRNVDARDDLYGHDCLLIGGPSLVPFGGEPAKGTAPSYWSALRKDLQRARRQGLTVIGMTVYPGPANDAFHRVC